MARRTVSPRSILTLAGALLLLTALLPMRFTAWVGWFREPLLTVVAPASGPLSALSSWLRPGRSLIPTDESAELADLRLQRDYYRSAFMRIERENDELRDIVRALQQGVPFGAAAGVRRLEASRVGADLAAGTIEVARGRNHGVTLNTVAVAAGAPQHLIGRVTSTTPLVSTVHLITDERISPRFVEALLLPETGITEAALAEAPRCQFQPRGDGTLQGDLGALQAEHVARGDLAYLDDAHWPAGAQRLVVGRVVRIEDTDRPLFKRIVIRPDFDPARVRSVILRIDGAADTTGDQR